MVAITVVVAVAVSVGVAVAKAVASRDQRFDRDNGLIGKRGVMTVCSTGIVAECDGGKLLRRDCVAVASVVRS